MKDQIFEPKSYFGRNQETVRDVSNLDGRITSCYIWPNSQFSTFEESLNHLHKSGYEVISLEETAILRMIGGIYFGCDINISRYPNISGKDCMTREAFVYVPKHGIFLTKNSPILENPKEASEAQRYGEEYALTNEQVERALADAVRVSCSGIPTNKFGESKIANYCFGGSAEDYGLFLRDAGINSMPINLRTREDTEQPFARQVVFSQLYVPVIGGIPGYSSLESYVGGSYLRGIKIEQKDGLLERLRQRFFPTAFERYMNLSKKEVKSGENPELSGRNQNPTCQGIINSAVKNVTKTVLAMEGKVDSQPKIAELSDAFGLSLDEEGRLRVQRGKR